MNEQMKLENEKMMEKCYAFMQELKDILGGAYTFGKSPIVETTCHLIPKGTEELNTYYSKPPKSFRCSDHWNWYANLKKCSNPNYVQCYNVDAFWPYKRTGAGATKHIWQCCVGYFADDNRFHVVYGQKFDRKTRETTWVEATPIEVLKEWLYDDPSDLGKYIAERVDAFEATNMTFGSVSDKDIEQAVLNGAVVIDAVKRGDGLVTRDEVPEGKIFVACENVFEQLGMECPEEYRGLGWPAETEETSNED